MTDEQLNSVRAAVIVKLGLHLDQDAVSALVRGLPVRHAVQLSLSETADLILRRFALGESETLFLQRRADPGAEDKLRDDYA